MKVIEGIMTNGFEFFDAMLVCQLFKLCLFSVEICKTSTLFHGQSKSCFLRIFFYSEHVCLTNALH